MLDKEDTHWKSGFCPYVKSNKGEGNGNVIERIDEGATFYRKHFFGKGRARKKQTTLTADLPLSFMSLKISLDQY